MNPYTTLTFAVRIAISRGSKSARTAADDKGRPGRPPQAESLPHQGCGMEIPSRAETKALHDKISRVTTRYRGTPKDPAGEAGLRMLALEIGFGSRGGAIRRHDGSCRVVTSLRLDPPALS